MSNIHDIKLNYNFINLSNILFLIKAILMAIFCVSLIFSKQDNGFIFKVSICARHYNLKPQQNVLFKFCK